ATEFAVPPTAHIQVFADQPRQVFLGVGGSLTQASAAALSTLSEEKRKEVLAAYFGAEGAAYGLSRTHIGSSDFSQYSYSHSPSPDTFSIDEDRRNGLLALIQDARASAGADFKLIASPWTAPPWMKDNNQFFDPVGRRGGRLLKEYYRAYAEYFVNTIQAYAHEGIPVWAVTPVNEPNGNAGSWESMDMSPEEQREVVLEISRAFKAADIESEILIFDQNRAEMAEFTSVILADPSSAPAVLGTAVHWYNSTFRVYEDVLEAQHALYPDKLIVQTEGTVDSLAHPLSCAGTCLQEPCGCEELYAWWKNDAWYWAPVATDWGWDWAENREVDHPKYAPAMRYARDLVVGVGHWLSGWVDWNIVLDKRGGPNHVENYCLAPVLVDDDEVYYTPIYYVLAQFSRHSRPGAQVLTTVVSGAAGLAATALLNPDGSLAVHVFNESGATVPYRMTLGNDEIEVEVPDKALQTVIVDGTSRHR
ncbi:MAG: glycoside hydrolase family 30 beta sandwich domain-containing protein, partial [Myxococcota bacterium]